MSFSLARNQARCEFIADNGWAPKGEVADPASTDENGGNPEDSIENAGCRKSGCEPPTVIQTVAAKA